MSYAVTYHPIAFEEAVEAITYLEENRPGYGRKFKKNLDALINVIQEKPEQYAPVKQGAIRGKSRNHFCFLQQT